MATLISEPSIIPAAGTPTKRIAEYVGRVNDGTGSVSIALMESPAGWSEPGQTPEFDEYTLVLDGELTVESEAGSFVARAGQALVAPAGEWVRYSTPGAEGARYVAVCTPAFSPETAHRDEHDG